MKRTLLLWIAALCAPAGCFGQIDWENFLAGQDMIWNRLPEAWDELRFWATARWAAISAGSRRRMPCASTSATIRCTTTGRTTEAFTAAAA